MKTLLHLACITIFCIPDFSSALFAGPIRPLAQEHVVVAESPDPQKLPLYNPTILRLPSGRLVAGYSLSNKHNKKHTEGVGMHFLTSDDGGATWTERAVHRIGQARLLLAGGAVYALGSNKLAIIRSDDAGATWSEPVPLVKETGWHQHAANFIRANGNIYLVVERAVNREIKAWVPGDLAPVLMRAREDSDLTKPQSWTFSAEVAFKDLVPGYRQNTLPDYFGVPFFPMNFPEAVNIPSRIPGKNLRVAPPGWLEANIAQITDPDHYWFDPAGRTFHVLLRAHTGGTGYAALCTFTEHADGSLTPSLQTAPSGKKILWLPMPGGQMRFHITHDEKTKLYWLLGSQATDSMTRSDRLPPERYATPSNERHRLVLHFSKNLVDWCFAGVVAIGDTPGQARHYAAMDIDGDDLVILSRSGDARAKNAHDGNLITFHRVRNFRALVY
ncbi:MAG: glycoside hydrolase [Opitutaceae bacterium]|jgi:hypothetical protein|nr:glycoside hydrolase [Opitutaceae bacterium]